ncbi:MAG TPA: SH3 domain-containing protein [Dehalococcoidia bacterium]|nr:SH3 domain-containing protein [Dehalococcoidia bacterium]
MALRLSALLALAALAALATACLGGGGSSAPEVAVSPIPSETAAIFQRSPLPSPTASPQASPTGTASPTATATAAATPATDVAVTPVAEPFDVTVTADNSGLRIRSTPSTNGGVLDAIYGGEKAKVLGEAHGQEVEPGKGDLWYQVEITRNGNAVRGFVYAAYVVKT